MRILYLLGGKVFSGAEITTLRFAAELAKSNKTVVCAHPATIAKVKKFNLNASRWTNESKKGDNLLRASHFLNEPEKANPACASARQRLNRLTRTFKPDVVVACMYPVAMLALPVLEKAGIPLIVHHQLMYNDLPNHPIIKPVRRVSKYAKCIIAASKAVEKPLIRSGIKNVKVVYAGLPENYGYSAKELEEYLTADERRLTQIEKKDFSQRHTPNQSQDGTVQGTAKTRKNKEGVINPPPADSKKPLSTSSLIGVHRRSSAVKYSSLGSFASLRENTSSPIPPHLCSSVGKNSYLSSKSSTCQPVNLSACKPFEFLAVGTWGPVKGLDYLIKAMELLYHKRQDFRLTIVGSINEYSRNYAAMIKELSAKGCTSGYIRFVGKCDPRNYYKISDALIVPSCEPDPFPTVTLEAMAHGLPVIAASIGGLAEQVTHGKTGFLVPERDSGALCNAMARLIRNRLKSKHMGQTGYFRKRTEFTLRTQAPIFLANTKTSSQPRLQI